MFVLDLDMGLSDFYSIWLQCGYIHTYIHTYIKVLWRRRQKTEKNKI